MVRRVALRWRLSEVLVVAGDGGGCHVGAGMALIRANAVAIAAARGHD
jgi:hypothetical protein